MRTGEELLGRLQPQFNESMSTFCDSVNVNLKLSQCASRGRSTQPQVQRGGRRDQMGRLCIKSRSVGCHQVTIQCYRPCLTRSGDHCYWCQKFTPHFPGTFALYWLWLVSPLCHPPIHRGSRLASGGCALPKAEPRVGKREIGAVVSSRLPFALGSSQS